MKFITHFSFLLFGLAQIHYHNCNFHTLHILQWPLIYISSFIRRFQNTIIFLTALLLSSILDRISMIYINIPASLDKFNIIFHQFCYDFISILSFFLLCSMALSTFKNIILTHLIIVAIANRFHISICIDTFFHFDFIKFSSHFHTFLFIFFYVPLL